MTFTIPWLYCRQRRTSTQRSDGRDAEREQAGRSPMPCGNRKVRARSADLLDKQAMTPAERQAAYRARKGKQVALILPDDVKEGLDAYLQRQHRDGVADLTMSEVVTKLLRAQLLRKR